MSTLTYYRGHGAALFIARLLPFLSTSSRTSATPTSVSAKSPRQRRAGADPSLDLSERAMTSPTTEKALPEVALKYQADEEEKKPVSKVTMIAGHTLIIGVVILLMTFLVRTSLAEMNGNVVSNRVNHAISQNRLDGSLMHAISKRSPKDDAKGSAQKDSKKDDKKASSTTPKPNGGERVESLMLIVLGMGVLTLVVSRI